MWVGEPRFGSWRLRAGALTIVAAQLALMPADVLGQGVARIVEDCATPCDLRRSLLLTIGDSAGAGYVGDPTALVRLENGTWVLADRFDQDRLKVFGADGSFARAVGRRGQGPGEFQVVQFVTALPGDSIEVFDLGQARFTVFTGSWDVARVQRVRQAGPEMLRFPDGSRVFAGRINLPEQIGLPLHHLSADGEHVASFGAEPIIGEVSNRDLFYRQLAMAGSDRLWAAPLVRYRLEQWTLEGNSVDVLERAPEWFPPQQEFEATPSGGQPPTPGLFGLHQDSSGYLWTSVAVPDADWSSGLGTGRDPWGRTVKVPTDMSALFDTVVEVIDPLTARVLGRTRLDGHIKDFAGNGLAYGVGEHPNGEPLIEIWRLQLPDAPDKGITRFRKEGS